MSEAIAYRSGDLVVFSNPTKAQINVLRNSNSHGEGLRAILHDNDLYVWNGYFANHDEVAEWVGISKGINVHLWTAYVEVDVADADYDDEEEDAKAVGARYAAIVRANRQIVRLYGATAECKIDDGNDDWWAPLPRP